MSLLILVGHVKKNNGEKGNQFSEADKHKQRAYPPIIVSKGRLHLAICIL